MSGPGFGPGAGARVQVVPYARTGRFAFPSSALPVRLGTVAPALLAAAVLLGNLGGVGAIPSAHPAIPRGSAPPPSAGAAVRPSDASLRPHLPLTYISGIDVSSYQGGSINWGTVYSDGNDFAFARAVEYYGTSDGDFATNMVNGKAAGVYMGAYDFVYPASESATSDADYFNGVIKAYVADGYMYPALDLEEDCTASGGSLDAAQITSWVNSWATELQSDLATDGFAGVVPIIYMNSNYASNCIDTSTWGGWALWIAEYYNTCATSPAPNTGVLSSYAYWQWCSSGSTGGISPVDQDVFNGDLSQLESGYVFGGGGPSASYAMLDKNTGGSLSCGGTFAVGDDIQYTATVSGGTSPYTYSWAFGDGTTGSGNPVTHEFKVAGTVDTILTVTDAKGQTGTTGSGCSFTVTGSLLTATAAATPTSGTVPLSVAFTGSAMGGSGTYSTWFWDFGDGSPHSTLQDPTHSYALPGSYTAKVTVNDSAGHSATSSSPAITVNAPTLTATASGSPSGGTAPLGVNFTCTPAGGTGGYSYAWTFGDGGTSTAQDPSHTYLIAGNFTPTVTVTDSSAAQVQVTLATISVAWAPLLASASANVTSGQAPLNVSFAGSASGGSGGDAFNWSFGDGSSSTLASPTHVFAGACTCQVVLTVTDRAGRSAQASAISISVAGGTPSPLSVTLSAPPSIALGSVTSFSASATGGTGTYTSYRWNFGDGSAPTSSATGATSYTYAKPGSYAAIVTVTDSSGASTSSAPSMVEVVGPTYVVVSGTVENASSSLPIAGASVTFWDSAQGGTTPSRSTLSNGTFREALAPGSVWVNATANGYVGGQSEMRLVAGYPTTLTLDLSPSGGTPVGTNPGPPGGGSSAPTFTSARWWTSTSYPGLYLLLGLALLAVGAAAVASRRRRAPQAGDLAPPPPGASPPYGGSPEGWAGAGPLPGSPPPATFSEPPPLPAPPSPPG